MARKLFERQAIRKRSGSLANGVAMKLYTDAAGLVLADISATLGGSAIAEPQVTTGDIPGLGPASLRFYGPPDGTDILYIRVPSDSSLGVQKIEADPDPRLDALEAGSASGIPGTILDAKGDIIAATAADTAARLAVGANNYVLTADSSTSTGLKWAAASGAQATPLLVALTGASTAADTAELDAKIAQVKALPANNRPALQLPPGDFTLNALAVIDFQGLKIQGSSRNGTRLIYNGTAALFSLNTFSTTPTPNVWDGAGQDFWLEDLTIYSATYADVGTNEGIRQGAAVQDNGGGGLRLRNVRLHGFKYGLCGAYGSDFSMLDDVMFVANDVGCYLGPGCQQVDMARCNFYYNREGLVLEGSGQGRLVNSWFILNSFSDVTVEGNTTSRKGVSGSIAGAYHDLGWLLEDCWFETDAGGLGRIAPRSVLVQGTPPGGTNIAHLKIRRPYLLSGGTVSATDCFLEIATAQAAFLNLEDLIVHGSHIQYAVKFNGVSPTKVYQRNTRQIDGGTNLLQWNTQSVDTITVDDWAAAQVAASSLASLAMWYEAAVFGTGSGIAVASWPDQSGNSRHLLQATSGNRPTLQRGVLRGRPVVRFDGADDYLVTATFGATIAQPTTIIIVVKLASVAGAGVIFDGKGSGRQNLAITPGQYDPWAGLDFTTGVPDLDWHVLTVVFNGASSLMREDGVQLATGDLGTQGLDGFALGAGPTGGAPLPCDIAEAIVYSQALSTANSQIIERALGTKYGIAVV